MSKLIPKKQYGFPTHNDAQAFKQAVEGDRELWDKYEINDLKWGQDQITVRHLKGDTNNKKFFSLLSKHKAKTSGNMSEHNNKKLDALLQRANSIIENTPSHNRNKGEAPSYFNSEGEALKYAEKVNGKIARANGKFYVYTESVVNESADDHVAAMNKLRLSNKNKWWNYTSPDGKVKAKGYNTWVQRMEVTDNSGRTFKASTTMDASVSKFKAELKDILSDVYTESKLSESLSDKLSKLWYGKSKAELKTEISNLSDSELVSLYNYDWSKSKGLQKSQGEFVKQEVAKRSLNVHPQYKHKLKG